MKTTHLLAASILAVSCVFLSASCIQDPAAALEPESSQGQQDGSEPIGEAQQRAVMKKLFETRYRFVGATVEQG